MAPSSSIKPSPRSEWLLPNGLGGFAMGTASGIPERRYHAWLVAATRPPLGRVVALHGCAEWLVIGGGNGRDGPARRLDLASFRFAGGGGSGGVVTPQGASALQRFEKHTREVRWEYAFDGITVTRTLSLTPRDNACTVRYLIRGLKQSARLEIRPFTPLRDFHQLRVGERSYAAHEIDRGVVEVLHEGMGVHIGVRRGSDERDEPAAYAPNPQWWKNFEYLREVERGQDALEDLYSPGMFTISSGGEEGDTCEVTLHAELVHASGMSKAAFSGIGEVAALATVPSDKALCRLFEAASDFVVKRVTAQGTALTSIIAGYPWFSDWGRDTFISMRGLLLCTWRYAEALQVLAAFARLQRGGLIPNCFDNEGHAEYNTVDASLWFVHAACEYVRMSGDRAGFATEVRQACLGVIESYREGTGFNIRMDTDGLILAGDATTQLTWMDARRDGTVFTPRHGKAVEINALWYSALMELAVVVEDDHPKRARELRDHAAVVHAAFTPMFWNAATNSLFDVITPAAGDWRPDASIRPNQLFALSQPYSPLSTAQGQGVLACAREHLLTPQGLRTLSPRDPGYKGRYEGSLYQRDSAYHNGAVWPWLIGPYAEAVLRTGQFSALARAEARRVIQPLIDEFLTPRRPGPINQIAEIYDGDEPRRADGCMAQAWSVAEVLRILWLCDNPTPK